jgi:hypothetical protein
MKEIRETSQSRNVVFSLHRGRSRRVLVRVVSDRCGLYRVEWPDVWELSEGKIQVFNSRTALLIAFENASSDAAGRTAYRGRNFWMALINLAKADGCQSGLPPLSCLDGGRQAVFFHDIVQAADPKPPMLVRAQFACRRAIQVTVGLSARRDQRANLVRNQDEVLAPQGSQSSLDQHLSVKRSVVIMSSANYLQEASGGLPNLFDALFGVRHRRGDVGKRRKLEELIGRFGDLRPNLLR